MTGLDARIARLEAAEAVRSVFAQYTQLMDAGHIDELMQVFGPGAELVAMNEPSTVGGYQLWPEAPLPRGKPEAFESVKENRDLGPFVASRVVREDR
ncbi:hypothetical protein [Ruixingdingia sedimenti]|uniref:SnoaL-like domain-containing protein n=1 Tax=Ruixingdingia sedimenti TaxID=3073604 RepID=A0ABU1FE95_9RHOB|nr:hypothetical protein [Xinfangfangia sp. LG-4]MDR5654789.1 hypothetical protein [Xinfangfangia sp. LG-4]